MKLSNTRLFILTLSVLASYFTSAQLPKHIFNEVTGEEFNPKDFSSQSKPIKQRLGVYHFGDSESEWDLVILSLNDSLIIQLFNGSWGENQLTKKATWLRNCQTFNTVTVTGNKFYFGKYSGMFAEMKEGKNTTKALLLFSDPIGGRNYGKDSAEVGFSHRLSTVDDFFSGQSEKDYYKLSTAVQPESFFSKRSKQELKIMRNSVYAKYGLIFQAGGEMQKYFRKKQWYAPHRKDVSDCLTEIEKRNLQTIARVEQL